MASKISTTKVSVLSTPQAKDDSFLLSEDTLSYLDVLSNDSGGNALSLYSLFPDASASASAAWVAAPSVSQSITTRLGASASIVTTGLNAGKLAYDTGALDYLAQDQRATDTFSYVVRLGNGTLSIATVTVEVIGTNDGPTVSNITVGADAGVVEDGPAYFGHFQGDDVDSDDDGSSLTYTIVTQPAEGTVSVDPNDPTAFRFSPGAGFQALGEGETAVVTFTYQATDRHGATSAPATVSITITGTAEETSGSVLDGYIANGLVFRDSNNNGAWDHEAFIDLNENGKFDIGEAFTDSNNDGQFTAEEFTFTDEQGNFAGLGGTGRIVLAPVVAPDGTVLTHDISTGATFAGTLTAPDGSSVVTPLTSLIDALAGAGATAADIAAAESLLKTALGLPADLALTTFDPLAAIAGSSDAAAIAAAIEVQKAAVQVANIVTVIASALEAAGLDGDAASQLAAEALATQIETAGGSADLGSGAFIGSVIEEAAQQSGSTEISDALAVQADAVAEALASVNDAIAQADSEGDPLAALATIVTAQIVAQGDLADQTASSVESGTVLDSGDYSGGNLEQLLDDAGSQVGVLLPTDTSGQTLGAPGRPSVDDGARISASEAADGIQVSVPFSSSAGAAAGDTLQLMLGGIVIASHVLGAADIPAGGASASYTFFVSAADLGADGAKVLSAQFIAAGGTAGVQSLPLVVTLDTTAPDAPAQLIAAEGTIISAVEALDGTDISGTVEAGSSVRVVVSNGAVSLERDAVVSASSFTVHLSATDLAQLGEGQVRYAATATDTAGNVSAASATGAFFYLAQPIVDTASRIDGGAGTAVFDNETGVGVTALDGGGFAARWVVDTNGDGDGDTLAIQRFAADGSKDGAVTVLQGLSSNLVNHGDNVSSFDLTTLDNGGYAVSYAVERTEFVRQLTLSSSPGGAVNFNVVGRPESFTLVSASGSPVVNLIGAGNSGSTLTVQLQVVNGVATVTQAVLDQFAVDNRFTLQVTGLSASTPTTVAQLVEEDVTYDPASALHNIAIARTVAGGVVSLFAPGRAEAFHIDSAAGVPTGANMVISPIMGASPINITGISGAVVQPNGTILITGLQPNANGDYVVPQQILDQLGTHDAIISLTLFGLPANSALTATVRVHDAIAVPEGVFVQTFDADGMAVPGSDVQVDTATSHPTFDNETGVGVTALDGGGFAARWVVDTNGDGDGDTLAIQRFAADGSKDGAVTVLQGLSSNLVNHGDNVSSFDLTTLDNGGYAVSYAVERTEFVRSFSYASTGSPFALAVLGRPEAFYVNAPSGATTISLTGLGNSGSTLIVQLPVVNGVATVTQAVLDQFAIDNRFSVTVVAPAGVVSVTQQVAEDVTYDPASALHDIAVSRTVGTNGAVVLSAPGRPEAFHIDSAAGVPAGAIMLINPIMGGNAINIGGIPGATLASNGMIQITGLQPNANGDYVVPQQILDQLGTHDASISLALLGLPANSALTATVRVHDAIAVPEGVFVQTFDAAGLAVPGSDVQVDTATSHPTFDNETGVGVTALDGGGFAARWVVDTNGDGDGDTLAIQRFAADGSKDGAVTVLQGLSGNLVNHGDNVSSFDLTTLDNGGYAVSYAVERTEFVRSFSYTSTGAPRPLAVLGRPEAFYVNGPSGTTTMSLTGLGNSGSTLIVQLPVVNGVATVTQAVLDQFAIDNRFSVTVSAPAGVVSVTQVVAEDVTYDPASALHDIAVNQTVTTNGSVVLSGPGRAEAFHIDSAAGVPTGAIMLINPIMGGNAINIGGIPGATLASNGMIQITGLQPNANGDYVVPQQILDQLGTHDASISLALLGLPANSALTATVRVHDAIAVPEGVFVQTFDAAGLAVSADLHLVGTAGDDVLVGDLGNDSLSALGGDNVLTGKGGSDTFHFGPEATGSNVITDFQPGVDKIDLSAIDAIAGTIQNEGFQFIDTQAFTGNAGELRLDVTAEAVTIRGDTDGDGVADLVVTLTGSAMPTVADLVL